MAMVPFYNLCPRNIIAAYVRRVLLEESQSKEPYITGTHAFRSDTMTKKERVAQAKSLSVDRFEGEFCCLEWNLNNGTVTRNYAEAMMAEYPNHLERVRDRKIEEQKKDAEARLAAKKRKAEQDAEDAKFDWVAEKQKCGGKGQTVTAWHKVPKTNQWDDSA